MEAAAVAAIPSEAAACALEAIPADGGVHVVEEEAVGAGERVAFWGQTLALADLEAPKVDALEIGVAVGEEGGLDLKSTG